MTTFLIRRLFSVFILLFVVLTLTFFIARLIPGDPIPKSETSRLSRKQLDDLRRLYGLDRPLYVQYGTWLSRVAFSWDWGTSFSHGRPAADVIMEALPNTLLLGGTAMVLQYAFGVWLGIWAARRAGGWGDSVVRAASLILYSVPTFWLGLMLILLFHLEWRLLPASGMASIDAAALPPLAQALDLARHMALPLVVLGLTSGAAIARYVRNSMLEVLRQDYVRTARAKGLTESRIVWLHSLRNAFGPLAQLIGLSLPAMLNGVLITEVIFAWPGIGQLVFKAAMARDYPMILVGTAYSAMLVISGNFLADLLHRWADPRVRHFE